MKFYRFLILLLLIPTMAYALRFVGAPIITAGSMGASLNSIGVNLDQLELTAIQAVWTGSPVGVLKIQVSSQQVPVAPGADPAANVSNWTDYTGSPYAISAAGDTMYNMSLVGYRWVRLVYTRTSGTGTMNATFSGKGTL